MQLICINAMRDRFLYMAGYAVFWLLFFTSFKGLFLVYQFNQTSELSYGQLFGVFYHGLAMDLSFTAYTLAIPYLLISIDTLIGLKQGSWLKPVLWIYTILFVFIYTFMCSADLELYKAWGFRLDDTPLNYINTPKEMAASVGAAPIWLLVIINIIFNVFFTQAYKRTLHTLLPWQHKNYRLLTPVMLLITGSLVIVMRGGLQTIPLNQSTVAFSSSYFANQAALNVPWNFAHSLGKRKNIEDKGYVFLAEAEADSILSNLYPEPVPLADSLRWLTTKKPNVILIIWESFTAKVAEPLGGVAGVTPNFTALSAEGLLFTRFYASADRSDKGLVALLSGYPSQPDATILKEPKKSRELPQLSHNFDSLGYFNSFYYGGELDFANLRAYLRSGAYQTLISDDDFEEKDRNSKWGAHDNVVAQRIMNDINNFPEPFFTNWFTLSSHEPFEIPMEYKFGNASNTDLFLSSHYYTDSVIGNFIDFAKKQDWWSNTLVIIAADHGHPEPNQAQGFEKNKFTIPMLWLGGALKQKGQYKATLSQTDLAALLLHELDSDASAYSWSKDPRCGQPAFASYVYKNGLGHVTDSAYVVYDFISNSVIADSGNTTGILRNGKGHLQKSYKDYLTRDK